MIKEERRYVVKGTYEVDRDVEDPSVKVAIRMAPVGASAWGPHGRNDEMTVIVPMSEAHLWAYGKTFSVTITEY